MIKYSFPLAVMCVKEDELKSLASSGNNSIKFLLNFFSDYAASKRFKLILFHTHNG